MDIPQVSDRTRKSPVHALRAVFTGVGQLFMAADRLNKPAPDKSAPDAAGPGDTSVHATTTPRNGTATQPSGAAQRPGRGGRTAQRAGQARRPASPAADARWRSLDQTGNVRLLSAEDLAEEFGGLTTSTSPASDTDPAPGSSSYGSGSGYGSAAYGTTAFGTTAYGTSAYDSAGSDSAGSDNAGSDSAASDDAATDSSADGGASRVAGLYDALEPDAAGPAEVAEAELPVPNYDSLSIASLRARLRNLDVGQLHTLAEYERSNAARTDVLMMFARRIEKLAAGG
jgi:hypothetical protein